MTKKHQFYFFLLRVWAQFNLIYKGRFVYTYSEEKEKFIRGVVTSFCGESIDRNEFDFEVGIDWLEPLIGYDSRVHTWGSYSLGSFGGRVRFKPVTVAQLKIGDSVLRRRSGDKEPQWVKTQINKTYKKLIQEFPEDYKLIY